MRRTIALLTTMALTLLVATSVAMAVTQIVCYQGQDVCYGTNDDDIIYGGDGQDTILAGSGNDSLFGGRVGDWLEGESGNDQLFGHSGNDLLKGGDGNDWMYGSDDNDRYSGLSGYDQVRDSGGTDDILNLSRLYRNQVHITPVDTSDADVNRDALLIEESGTTNSVLVYNYFNNLGGTDRGVGAIETIEFKGDRLFTQQMAIPAYFSATSPYWTKLQSSGGPVSIAVMNPSSGPGQRQNLDYVNTVNKTKAAGVRVFGYVYTDYGARSLSAVKSDIDKYYEWYNVDGVFLDEAEYRDCTDDAYYQDLYNHLKAKGGQVILNPGTQTEECYADSADVIVNFEGTYDAYARKDGTGAYEYDKTEPAWVHNYPPSLFWHLVHGAPDEAAMRDAVGLGKQRRAYHMYVTPDVLPNPWDTLPADPYWSEELTALSSPSCC